MLSPAKLAATEVRAVEARIEALQNRFAEERLAASRLQLEWGREREAAEKLKSQKALD